MSKDAPRWTLENLVDFEQAAVASPATPAELRREIATVTRGLDGAAARRVGLRIWLGESRGAVRKFTSALALVGGGLALLTFLGGISAVLGLLDRGGVNVTLFLAILIGGQWLVLVLAAFAWLLRRRAAEGFSLVQAAAGKLARRLAGGGDDPWWQRVMDGGGAPRAALLWRLARVAQTAGIAFNLGILVGLSGLVLLRQVGFFWETTTELAMRSILEMSVRILAAPWAILWPAAVPDAAVIDASRWRPESIGALPPGPPEWWQFLLMATLVWGLLPRAVLWLVAWRSESAALGKLDFQARHHRVLWREIMGTERVETDEKPLDGVLVLDVGGSGLAEETLRPFLLRRLRVHPAAWRPVAVLDSGAEDEAARALEKAPAGVVLLAEGWSLSPPRMLALLAKIRAHTGAAAPVKFLVANVGPDHEPVPVNEEERREWGIFVDSLRDPAAEIFFFENDQRGL